MNHTEITEIVVINLKLKLSMPLHTSFNGQDIKDESLYRVCTPYGVSILETV